MTGIGELKEQLVELQKRLKTNPIYALSLGSREVFHSNFLAWMFENYPAMIAAVANDFHPENVEIWREVLNLDLVILFGEENIRQAVVIEIKVKDTPKLNQLKEYDEKLKKRFGEKPQKVILSLVDAPETLNDASAWRPLSFCDLGQRIKGLIPKIEISRNHSNIISDYAQLCCDLDQFVTKVIEADRGVRKYYFALPGKNGKLSEIDKIVEDLRFADTLNKYRASALCEEIRQQVEEIDFRGLHCEIGFGLNNKTPNVSASFKIKPQEETEHKLKLEIHIQGSQYRRVLSFDRYTVNSKRQGKNDESMKSFIENTDRWHWMFGPNHQDGFIQSDEPQSGYFCSLKKIHTKQQKNKLLCSYAPSHIYQYTNISNKAGVPIDNLVEAVIADLKYAADLLQDSRYIDRFVNWSP